METKGRRLDVDVLDEAYVRLHETGPEFDGWLSNHGPMAADALMRLGHGEEVPAWVSRYSRRLDDLPRGRQPMTEAEWPVHLGDHTRLGDWLELFGRILAEEPWADVLVRWWPRLLPGAAASATHGLIRTGHAVRALLECPTEARVGELAHALGYWAARWLPVPGSWPPFGVLDAGPALDAIPVAGADGGFRERLAALGSVPGWSAALAAVSAPVDAEHVPAGLDALTDAAVERYARWAPAEPTMLVHAATAPRAAALVLPALPLDYWRPTFVMAWTCSAAVAAAYRPDGAAPPSATARVTHDLAERAADHGDEHVLKFAEVALQSHRRGNERALEAGLRAVDLIGRPDERG